MIRKFSRIAFLAGLILLVYLSLLPADLFAMEVTTWDKVNHAAAYAVLAFVGRLCIRHGRPQLFVAVTLLILGTGLELAQAAVPNRSPSPYDAMANLIGIVLGTSLIVGACVVRRRWARAVQCLRSPG